MVHSLVGSICGDVSEEPCASMIRVDECWRQLRWQYKSDYKPSHPRRQHSFKYWIRKPYRSTTLWNGQQSFNEKDLTMHNIIKESMTTWKHQAPYMQQPFVHTPYSSSEHFSQDIRILKSKGESGKYWYFHQEWNFKEIIIANCSNDYNLKYLKKCRYYINDIKGKYEATQKAIHL